ncbi:MAG: (Fe-S)-binding protein [Dehalococcoidia bacterium]|nr:(Fe-S)-binding protein [Dehalococcoidia bacterium]MDD5495441.1 (Fe-S)-binding protein [Dehalococcoidia bacterium]
MISEKSIANIKEHGIAVGDGARKKQILEDEIGYPAGKKAEYVIIAGCFQAEGMPQAFRAFKQVLDHLKVSYTLLGKEYCCGWMSLGQPAVFAKNEEDIASFKQLSRDFVVENFKQAKDLGAKSIALFCAACEPTYTNYSDLTDLEIISSSELINRFFKRGKLAREIDYYAGCYRFRRRITDKPVDVAAAESVLNKIEGLEVNHLDSKLCCNIPPHQEQLLAAVKTNTVVNICSGCFYSLQAKLAGRADVKVKMLPEIVLEALPK